MSVLSKFSWRRLGAVAVTVLGLCAVTVPAVTVPSQPAEARVFVSVGIGGPYWGGGWGYRPYYYGYYRPYRWGYRPYWRAGYRSRWCYWHPYRC